MSEGTPHKTKNLRNCKPWGLCAMSRAKNSLPIVPRQFLFLSYPLCGLTPENTLFEDKKLSPECPCGEGNWAARQGQKLSRGSFYAAANRCLTGPSGKAAQRGNFLARYSADIRGSFMRTSRAKNFGHALEIKRGKNRTFPIKPGKKQEFPLKSPFHTN